jgi:hypothetical protein
VVDGEVVQTAPDPARPRSTGDGVKTVEQLHLQAPVLNPEVTDAEAARLLGAANQVPGDEALGAGRAIGGRLEEGATQLVQSFQEASRELHRPHGVGRQRVQDRSWIPEENDSLGETGTEGAFERE